MNSNQVDTDTRPIDVEHWLDANPGRAAVMPNGWAVSRMNPSVWPEGRWAVQTPRCRTSGTYTSFGLAFDDAFRGTKVFGTAVMNGQRDRPAAVPAKDTTSHDAPCPTCRKSCGWTRSESDWESNAPVSCTYFHRCPDHGKFTHQETA